MIYVNVATITCEGKKLAYVIIIDTVTSKNIITTVFPNNAAPNRHIIRLSVVTKVE